MPIEADLCQEISSTWGPSVPGGKGTRRHNLERTPYLQRLRLRVELPEGTVFTFVTLRNPSHSEPLFGRVSKNPLSTLIWQTWKFRCLDWQGPERGSNLSKFTQLLIAELGSEPNGLSHHLGFSPCRPQLHCLMCTFHWYLYSFYLPNKTAFSSHLLCICCMATIMIAVLWM